jgi:hypothetical protein
MDKSTKLETIYDRIHALEARFEILNRDAEIEYLRSCIVGGAGQSNEQARIVYERKCQQYRRDFEFLREVNVGGESMHDEDIARVTKILHGYSSWPRSSGSTPGAGAGRC